MSLSSRLQSPQILESVPGMEPASLKALLLGKGAEWYEENPREQCLIRDNLGYLDLPAGHDTCSMVQEHVALHYYEKLLPLCGGPASYARFLREHVDADRATVMLSEVAGSGSGVLLAVAHFGAVEFIVPELARRRLPVNAALRFTTEQFSEVAHARVEEMARSGDFGPIRLIEIGRPGTRAALDMAAALRRGELLVSVFDERTDYSKPVRLFGTQVWGGAGLDKLLTFAQSHARVFTAFMLRTGMDAYGLVLNAVDTKGGNPVQEMFCHLEEQVRNHVEQWYFLHEPIPFVATADGSPGQ